MDRVPNFSDASEDEDDKVSRRVTTDIFEVLNFYSFCVVVLVKGFGIYSPLYCFSKIKVPHHFSSARFSRNCVLLGRRWLMFPLCN